MRATMWSSTLPMAPTAKCTRQLTATTATYVRWSISKTFSLTHTKPIRFAARSNWCGNFQRARLLQHLPLSFWTSLFLLAMKISRKMERGSTSSSSSKSTSVKIWSLWWRKGNSAASRSTRSRSWYSTYWGQWNGCTPSTSSIGIWNRPMCSSTAPWISSSAISACRGRWKIQEVLHPKVRNKKLEIYHHGLCHASTGLQSWYFKIRIIPMASISGPLDASWESFCSTLSKRAPLNKRSKRHL